MVVLKVDSSYAEAQSENFIKDIYTYVTSIPKTYLLVRTEPADHKKKIIKVYNKTEYHIEIVHNHTSESTEFNGINTVYKKLVNTTCLQRFNDV